MREKKYMLNIILYVITKQTIRVHNQMKFKIKKKIKNNKRRFKNTVHYCTFYNIIKNNFNINLERLHI